MRVRGDRGGKRRSADGAQAGRAQRAAERKIFARAATMARADVVMSLRLLVFELAASGPIDRAAMRRSDRLAIAVCSAPMNLLSAAAPPTQQLVCLFALSVSLCRLP